MSTQWAKSWNVPGSHGAIWKVSQRADGSFGCSCPAWKFAHAPKPDCHHILAVRAHPAVGEISFRPVILANVAEVTASAKGLLTPLIPVGDAWFAATVAYDLRRLGASPEAVRRYLYGNALHTVCAYVEEHGRKIYGPFKRGRGYEGFRTVPVMKQG